MHPLNKLCGIVFALCAMFVAARCAGGHPELLVTNLSITPLVLILGLTLGGLMASHGLRDVTHMLAVAMFGKPTDPAAVPHLQQICRRGQKLAYTACILELVFDTMHVLAQLDEARRIGPAIGQSLVAIIYAVLIAELGFGSAERWVAANAAHDAPTGA